MKRKIELIILLFGFIFCFARSVQSQSSDFIIDGADAVNTFTASGSSELNSLTSNLQDRFVLTWANAKRVYNVVPFAQELTPLLQQVPDRIVLQYAQDNKENQLIYPAGMFNDTTVPTARDVTHTILSPTSVKITWATDEYATSVVAYGESSSSLPQTAADPLFARNHSLTLTDLRQNQTYFYRVSGVDRSGNSFQSVEFSFRLETTSTITPTFTHTATPVPPTPTDTSVTPTPVTSPTNTPVPPTDTPTIREIRPNQGSADVANTINIYGTNFAQGATARLGNTTLTVTYISVGQLQAEVPAGLTPGTYALTVTNPNGATTTLAAAYTVLGTETDDLTGYAYELWVEPAAPQAGVAVKAGLVIHRQGGKQVLSNVVVHLYVGDPMAGGRFVGAETIPLLSPRDTTTGPGVNWTPPTAGAYELYAVIDPSNTVAETNENNNGVHRTVQVIVPAADLDAPHVDSFTINDGDTSTSERAVRLNTTVSDPAPGAVTALLFMEYEYSQGANQWVLARVSDWLDYTTARTNYAWTLLPSIGMHYVQVWAMDSAGNISSFPYTASITYNPPVHRVGTNQVRIYRYDIGAGEQVTVRVQPSSGDPDLYVWPPDYTTRPPYVSNLATGVDDVSFVAPVAGIYQVEVYGYSAAEYQLVVDHSTTLVVATARTGGIDPSKGDLYTEPYIAIENEPSTRVAIPPSGQTVHPLYLPLIQR